MPISAGLREDIAVYRGFIGQQYIHNSGVMRFDEMSHREKERTEAYKTKQW